MMAKKSWPANRSFTVEIPENSLQFQVGEQENLVTAALKFGIEIPTACQDGQCGTCLVRVLQGEIEHRDQALSPEKQEEGWMCACVSRAKGEHLEIELW